MTPDVLARAHRLDADIEEKARLFSLAISHVRVGETYKTTGDMRTRLADGVIVKLAADFSSSRVLDAGASDGFGTSSLIRRLGEGVDVLPADLHPVFYKRRFPFGAIFFDGASRMLSIKFLFFSFYIGSESGWETTSLERIDTTNPMLEESMGPFAIRPFDVFGDAIEPKFEIIKCANLLNSEYFDLEGIRAAASNLSRSLSEGGFLVISQNNDRYSDGEAYFVLQLKEGRLMVVDERNSHDALEAFSEELS
ncbi:MAG: hypothetical protein OCC46_09945 [Pseudodesulfovibrio sp.]